MPACQPASPERPPSRRPEAPAFPSVRGIARVKTRATSRSAAANLKGLARCAGPCTTSLYPHSLSPVLSRFTLVYLPFILPLPNKRNFPAFFLHHRFDFYRILIFFFLFFLLHFVLFEAELRFRGGCTFIPPCAESFVCIIVIGSSLSFCVYKRML